MPLLVREDLSWDEVARVAVHAPELPGVVLDSGLLRDYPEGTVLAHVLGYVGAVNPAEQAADQDPLLQLPEFRIGKSGIERSYDAVLRGRAGLSRVEVNAIGREIRELDRREGVPGVDVRLALDLDLQRFCVARLSSELSASAVVVDVRSGGVLALASVPSFEPARLHRRPAAERLERAARRSAHAAGQQVHPGPVPAGLHLQDDDGAGGPGGRDPADLPGVLPGHTSLGSAVFHCWKEHGHGRSPWSRRWASPATSTSTIWPAGSGVDAIAAMAAGSASGGRWDRPARRTAGADPDHRLEEGDLGQSWQKGETLVCGIGQGYVRRRRCSSRSWRRALANGGLGGAALAGGAGARRALRRAPLGRAACPLSSVVPGGMREVVHGGRGTARAADLGMPGVEMAGKTGTAQVRRISRAERAVGRHKRKDLPWAERDHALFVCFAPFAEPRYAVAVVVEHGMSGAEGGLPDRPRHHAPDAGAGTGLGTGSGGGAA